MTVRSEEYKFRTAKRSLDMIRRLTVSNFTNKSMRHVTLTFSPSCNFDITDLSKCNKKFNLFVHRIRAKYKKFMFIKVAEFTKKGVVHFHMVCNVAFIPSKVLASYWTYGFISVSKCDVSISGYMFKYLVKSVGDPRFGSARLWSRSSNLVKPYNVYGDKAVSLACDIINMGYTPRFSYKYRSPNLGLVRVFEFDLFRDKPVFNRNKFVARG